ncbi:AfsR/SARP family transcriptional regulator [Planosporangium sp. 12N6]|uniref:AfsR/SARP family transcriptional regulator n=1 Tax=Planosporangium spinosum TaxID=3402278 RepID=UPI003CE8AFCC
MDERDSRAYRVEVELLGQLRVCRAGAAVPLPGTRLRGLLARLALSAGRPVDTTALVDALWPEARPADPANALQSLVSRLRRALGSADTVEQVSGGYRLAVSGDAVDLAHFERLVGEGQVRLRAGDPARASALITEAMALWRGPVAAEVAAVAPAAAVRLAHARTEAAADLAEADLLLGRSSEVAARLPALLVEQPLHERLAGLYMDALAGLGRQAEALAVYERVRHDLADRLGADPGSALRDRHLRLLQAGTGPGGDATVGASPAPDTAPAPADAPPPGNLPAAVTSFVGRDEDLARVEVLLDTGRLVTVLGPGGAGKTRLAVEAAGRLGGRYPGGTWLVDLAPVTEPAEVASTIVSALGMRGTALFEQRRGRGLPDGRNVLDVLVERLAPQDVLLVVDNCEHLIEAVAQVTTALLVRCPRLRVLATSREPLVTDGEALVPLAPLELPPADANADTAARTQAVRLFVERAAAVRPGFTVDATTVRDVVEVVRRLDGLPLALELAAARLRTLPLAELAAGLSDRFRLLTGGNRTALPRHRTLGAVIAWSWDLLGAAERTLAERVSVLPAGVTPRSATAVCAGTGIDPDHVPELLAALVDRSLLQLAGEGPRYRMLETLREYGVERLAERGELTAVRELAARHVAALVATTDPLLRTADQLPALRLLRAEYDNALAALRHLCDSGDGPAAVQLALDLCWYWQILGHHAEAVFWLREAMAAPGEHDPVTLDCARALQLLNTFGVDPAALTESADTRRDRLRALAARLAAHDELPGLAGVLAFVLLYFAGDPAGATQRVEAVIAGDDRWLSALALLFRARLAENEGDVAQVRHDVEAALAGFQAAGDRWGQATTLPLRALVRQYGCDLDGAVADLRAARTLSREFGSLDVADEVFLEFRWVDLHLRRGEPEVAVAALAVARARAERATSPEVLVLVDALEAGFLVRRGELGRAERLLCRAEQRAAVDGPPLVAGDHAAAIVGSIRATLEVARGDLTAAEAALVQAYAAAVTTRDMPILALVAVGAAELADARGWHREAALLLGAADRLRGSEDPTDLRIAALTRRGEAALGPAAFAEAYTAGWSLDAQAALARVDPAPDAGAVAPAAATTTAGAATTTADAATTTADAAVTGVQARRA